MSLLRSLPTWIALLWTFTAATGPGVSLSIRQAWANSLVPSAVQYAETALVHNFGNFSFAYTSDFGTVHFNFTNVNVTAFSVNAGKTWLEFGKGNEVNVTIGGVTGNVSVGYQAKYGVVEYQGQAEVYLPSLNVSLNATITSNSSHPQLTINNLSLSVAPLLLTSSLSSVTNAIVQHEINSQLGSLSVSVLPFARQHLPLINSLLQQTPLIVSLPGGFAIDIGLGDDVLTTSTNVLGLKINGTVFVPGKPVAGAYDPPVTLPIDFPFTEGLALSVSDFTVNTAISAYFSQLDMFIDSLPAGSPVSLTTTALAVLFPGLKATFGPNVPLGLRLAPGSAFPQYYTNGEINFSGILTVAVEAKQGEAWVPGVTLSVDMSVTMTVSLENSVVSGTISGLDCDITVVSSAVGTVNSYLLNLLLKDAAKVYLPAVNALLKNQAIPIPEGLPVTVAGNDLGVFDGYVQLAVQLAPKDRGN